MAKKISLTRDQILAARDIHGEWVEVPEWGGSIFVRRMAFSAIDEVNADILSGSQSGAVLLVHCVVDPDTGAPLFSLADVEALLEKDSAVFIRVVKEANRINSLDNDAPKDGAAG